MPAKPCPKRSGFFGIPHQPLLDCCLLAFALLFDVKALPCGQLLLVITFNFIVVKLCLIQDPSIAPKRS